MPYHDFKTDAEREWFWNELREAFVLQSLLLSEIESAQAQAAHDAYFADRDAFEAMQGARR